MAIIALRSTAKIFSTFKKGLAKSTSRHSNTGDNCSEQGLFKNAKKCFVIILNALP
jgi:hypothetical protein